MSSPGQQPSHLLLDLSLTGVHVPSTHSFKHVSGLSYHVLSRHRGFDEGKGKPMVVTNAVPEDEEDNRVDDAGDDKVGDN